MCGKKHLSLPKVSSCPPLCDWYCPSAIHNSAAAKATALKHKHPICTFGTVFNHFAIAITAFFYHVRKGFLLRLIRQYIHQGRSLQIVLICKLSCSKFTTLGLVAGVAGIWFFRIATKGLHKLRSNARACTKSSGSSDTKLRRSLVRGCSKPSVFACSAGRPRPFRILCTTTCLRTGQQRPFLIIFACAEQAC